MKQIMKRGLITFAAIVCLCLRTLAMPDALVPVGKAVGIHLQGALTIAAVEDRAGSAGLRIGDRIVSVNGTEPKDIDELRALIEDEKKVILAVERDGKLLEIETEPERREDGGRLGVRIRDGINGVGTVTFYDPETGRFGALGHGVNDPQTGRRVEMCSGSVTPCRVTDVQRGRIGAPGELHAALCGQTSIGELGSNTGAGVFGTMTAPVEMGEALPLAQDAQVKPGPAQILSNVAGTEVRSFSVTILKTDPGNRDGRNYLLQVCDEDLLCVTGGIVQGMSGSPIVQDGRFVGAVTHVLVDDPTIGYGISIGNMLAAASAAGT